MNRSENKHWRKMILLTVGVVLLVSAGGLFLWKIFPSLEEDLEIRRETAVQDAVEKAAFECYAVEGIYPQRLDYLEENYGLMINHDRYIVSYECFAANQRPEIMVLKK